MRALVLGLAVVLVGCDDGPAENPSPIVPLRLSDGGVPVARAGPPPQFAAKPVDAPAAPTPPVPAKPAAVPTAEDLKGRFTLHQRSGNAEAMTLHEVILEGDAKGAVFTDVHGEGESFKVSRNKMDAAAVAALLGKLDALKWWTLGNEEQDVMDATGFSLTLQRGAFSHSFRVYGVSAGPQMDAMALVTNAKKGPPITESAPEKKVFAPKPLVLGKKRSALQCIAGPGGALWCDGDRCLKRGKKQVDCYFAPGETGRSGVIGKMVKPGWTVNPGPWAVQVEDGRMCVGTAQGEGYSCQDPKRPHSWRGDQGVRRLVPSGAGYLAMMQNDRDRLELQRVVAIWP